MPDEGRGIIPTGSSNRGDDGRTLATSDRTITFRDRIGARSGSTVVANESDIQTATVDPVSSPPLNSPVQVSNSGPIVSSPGVSQPDYNNPLATVGELYLRGFQNPGNTGTNTITTAPVATGGGSSTLLILLILGAAGFGIWYFYGRG